MGLLAKLHHGVAELLDEAAGVLNTASRECNDISSRIVVCVRSFAQCYFYIPSSP